MGPSVGGQKWSMAGVVRPTMPGYNHHNEGHYYQFIIWSSLCLSVETTGKDHPTDDTFLKLVFNSYSKTTTKRLWETLIKYLSEPKSSK